MPSLVTHQLIVSALPSLLDAGAYESFAEATSWTFIGTAHDTPEDIQAMVRCQKLLHLASLFDRDAGAMRKLLGAETYGIEDFDRYWSIQHVGHFAPCDDNYVYDCLRIEALDRARVGPDEALVRMWSTLKERVGKSRRRLWLAVRWLAGKLTERYGGLPVFLHLPSEKLHEDAARNADLHGAAVRARPRAEAGIALSWKMELYGRQQFEFAVWKTLESTERCRKVAEGTAEIEIDRSAVAAVTSAVVVFGEVSTFGPETIDAG